MKKGSYGWFLISTIFVVIFGTIYATVQQAQRSEANSPQIQLAQDAVLQLEQGENPNNVSRGTVEMSRSLAPFIIVYDKNGKAIAGNGQLNGGRPAVPIGVLKASDKRDYNAVTWEPYKNVRIAAVVVSTKNYYILSGRSLKEVEKNEALTLRLTLLGGLLALAIASTTLRPRKE